MIGEITYFHKQVRILQINNFISINLLYGDLQGESSSYLSKPFSRK